MTEDRGGWIQTYTGRSVYPMDLHPNNICISDIAHALSLLCRYGGHCLEFYSVAQHSVLASQHVPSGCQLWALMHDAAEAYIVDIPRPIKQTLPVVKAAELRILDAIGTAFHLPKPYPEEIIKIVDLRLLCTERRDLMTSTGIAWSTDGYEPLPDRIRPLDPKTAERQFLDRFVELKDEQCI